MSRDWSDGPTRDGIHPGKLPDVGRADVTRIIALDDSPPAPFPKVFARAFGPLSQLYRSFPRDGLLVAAVSGRRVAAYVHLPVAGQPAYATVGRHPRCDLVLPDDPGVSLRHLIVGCSRRGLTEPRVKVWDLASGLGFRTEDDLPCEALVCEGPVFVRVAGHHLFLLPTGDLAHVAWSDTAEATWASFPERILLDRRVPSRSRPDASPFVRGVEPAGKGRKHESIITQIMPPARPVHARQRQETQDGTVVARIQLSSRDSELAVPVTDRDLEFGLLVGRYERCQLGGTDDRLSRVHVLIVRDADGVWAIDTASTNGMEHAAARIRALRLEGATELSLAHVMTVRWTPGAG